MNSETPLCFDSFSDHFMAAVISFVVQLYLVLTLNVLTSLKAPTFSNTTSASPMSPHLQLKKENQNTEIGV